ncbi:hypothetical protein BDV19DRAFT_387792 [Aspergillus venezuelensis]
MLRRSGEIISKEPVDTAKAGFLDQEDKYPKMQLKAIVLSWLVSAFYLAAGETTIDSLFTVKLNTDESGGCKARSSLLKQYLQESKDLAAAGLQAIEHAQDSSASQHDVAKRYLQAYFAIGEDDATALTSVKDNLQKVSNFLSGKKLDNTPRLYCHDTWLKRHARTDIAWDTDGNEIRTMDKDGVEHPLSIENCEQYKELFWYYDDGRKVWKTNKQVPYWSDDLSQYLADADYGSGGGFCTGSNNQGGTQHMTTPSTITLCPISFTSSSDHTPKLGSRSPANGQKGGIKLPKILPRSVTLYHELFHLVLGSEATPDATYEWHGQELLLKTPELVITKDYAEEHRDILGWIMPEDTYGLTAAEAIRRNPESYAWFSVAYWYFMQTKWSKGDDSQRWSFHSGLSQLVKI